MRIVSWNVNGIRAAVKKGFVDWLEGSGAAIVGLQEVRALQEQLPKALTELEGWWQSYSPAERKGYSGVGFLARRQPDEITSSMGIDEFDIEGRLQIARWGKLSIANVYFPNGSGKRDNSRVPYKLAFYRRLYEMLEQPLKDGGRVLVMGDYNTAHQEIDLARPKQNQKTSGFLLEERQELSRWLAGGWSDTFRHFYPEAEGQYSWWSQRLRARERNVGWRIDYVLATPAAMPFVQEAFIDSQVMGKRPLPCGRGAG